MDAFFISSMVSLVISMLDDEDSPGLEVLSCSGSFGAGPLMLACPVGGGFSVSAVRVLSLLSTGGAPGLPGFEAAICVPTIACTRPEVHEGRRIRL